MSNPFPTKEQIAEKKARELAEMEARWKAKQEQSMREFREMEARIEQEEANQDDEIGRTFFGDYGEDEYDEAVAASQEARAQRAAADAEWQSVSTEAQRVVAECGLTRKVEHADDDFALQSTYEYWSGVAANGSTVRYQYMTMQGCQEIIRDYKAGKLVAKAQGQPTVTNVANETPAAATYVITDTSADSRKHWISVARSMGYTVKMYGAEMRYATAPDGTSLKNYQLFIAHLAKTIEEQSNG